MSSPHPSKQTPPAAPSLYKQNSWSPDSHRDEAWLRQKGRRNRRSRSVTYEGLEELKACIELGFDFDSPEMDQRLSDTFPAYGLYYAVNKQYNDGGSSSSALDSHHAIFGPGKDPEMVKTKLRQWAQAVACTFVSHSRSLAAARRLVDSPRRRQIPLQPLFPPSAVNLRNNMESDSTSPINLEGDDVDVSMKDTLIPGQSECHEDGVKKEELRKKRRLSSGVWSHFRILPAKPNEQLYCECIKCKKKYLADSKMGTGIAEMSLEEITQDIMALNFNKDAVESIGEASSSKI